MRKRWTVQEVSIKEGTVFGRWTVIDYVGMTNKGRSFLCSCSCGTQRIVAGSNLRSGMSKSCGCKRFDSLSLSPGTAAKNHMFSIYKQSAARRNKIWCLSREQFEVLINGNCYFCGAAPTALPGYYKAKRVEVRCSGIDRLDNNIGYTIDNTVSCCKTCNYAKRFMSQEEFKSWIDRVYNHFVIPGHVVKF